MKILITGKTGVGKTTLLKNLENKNIIFADDLVKNVFYKNDHPCFKQVVNHFGNEIITNDHIDTKKLGSIVLNNQREFDELSNIVNPFVYEYIKNLNGDYIIEMAAYAKYESYFKDLFDKVILITRDKQIMDDKFKYMNSRVNPLNVEPEKFDYKIINDNLDRATEELKQQIEFSK